MQEALEEQRLEDRVIDALKSADKPLGPKDLAEMTNSTEGSISNLLPLLKAQGKVTKKGRGNWLIRTEKGGADANNNGADDEPRLAREPLKKIEPDTTRRPALVINSGGKPWLAFYQAADADGTWILRAEVIDTATMDAGGGNLKLQSEYEPLETQ